MEIVAKWGEVGLYGSGEGYVTSLEALCQSIIEYYETLIEEKDNLGPEPEKHLEIMKEYIAKPGFLARPMVEVDCFPKFLNVGEA